MASELAPLLAAAAGAATERATTLRILLGEIARLQDAGVITVNRSCLTCRHYQPPGGRSLARCLLLGTTLADRDLRLDSRSATPFPPDVVTTRAPAPESGGGVGGMSLDAPRSW